MLSSSVDVRLFFVYLGEIIQVSYGKKEGFLH